MKKLIMLAMVLSVAIFVLGCDEEDTASKSEVSDSICTKMSTCSPDMYNSLGDACSATIEGALFSEADCSSYNSELGAKCQGEVSSMSCEDFNAKLADQGGSTSDSACDTMCK